MSVEQPFGSSEWKKLLAEQLSRHGKQYYALAYRILRDSGAAQDAIHQAMVAALERPAQLRDPRSLRTWLATMITRECCLVLRRGKVNNRALQIFARKSAAYETSEFSTELQLAVVEAVEALPDAQRAIIALRLLEGMTGNEVTNVLGISAATVSRQYHLGMEALRESLKDWNS